MIATINPWNNRSIRNTLCALLYIATLLISKPTSLTWSLSVPILSWRSSSFVERISLLRRHSQQKQQLQEQYLNLSTNYIEKKRNAQKYRVGTILETKLIDYDVENCWNDPEGDRAESIDSSDTVSINEKNSQADEALLPGRIKNESRATVVMTVAVRKNNNGGGYKDLGKYDPSENLATQRDVPNVGNPQLREKEKEQSVTDILKELAAIQQQGPQKYLILGTRHCSYLHQQIIELLAYALVLSGNHVYTSGAGGTHAATIRGALRAERDDLLTVVLPQSMSKQTNESQELLRKVEDLVEMPQNDDMSLDVASRICNSHLLSLTDQLISFAFHESNTVIEAFKEAKSLDMLVTTLYLD